MLAKLNFLQSRYYILFIALVAILAQPLSASTKKSCDYRIFNIKTTDTITSLDLLTQLADSCDFSIVIKDNFAADLVKKELYGVNIKNMSLDEVFELLLSDNDLYYEYNKNFLKISALKTKTFKVDYITSVRQGTANIDASVDIRVTEGDTGGENTGNGDNTIVSNDTFDFWGTVQSEILSIMNTGEEEYVAKEPIVNPNAGLVTVTGTKNQLDRVKTYINKLQDSLHKQVLIDVSILSVTLENESDRGINWSKFDLSLSSVTNAQDTKSIASSLASTSNTVVNIINQATFTMEGLINFLDTNGNTKVVSSPKVLAMNNQPAIITVGDNINYRIAEETNNDDTNSRTITYNNYSMFIGILLNITPEVTKENDIILRINPSISSLKYKEDRERMLDREIAPDTKERKISTVVKVKNGNTIILGGLIARADTNENQKVPLLGDIPLLGEAFKYKGDTVATTELVFVITPRLIGSKDNTKTTLKDLGFSKKIYEE
jgi:general secretion pathway protein D